jgi:putative hydrolase of the HAD superfamily
LTTLSGRDVWVFDLDNTLYPANHAIFDEIGHRMTAYIARFTGGDEAGALALREKYFRAYGATVTGLVAHHGADAADFLHYVHDLPLDSVAPDPELGRLISRLPGRRIVYTNGAADYARRILARLEIAHAFERVFALEDADFHPKPQRQSFDMLIARCGIDPARAVMFEDHDRNLETAAVFGFATVLVGDVEQPTVEVDFATSDLHAFLRTVLDQRMLTAARAAPSERA